MLVSISLITKGVLFLWKAHGTHLALMKGGAYLYSTYGLGTTIAGAKTVAICAGCVGVASTTVGNSVEGFELLRDGIIENNPSKTLKGFWNFKKAYTSIASLINGFSFFLDNSNVEPDLTDYLINGANEIASYLKDKTEEQAIELIAVMEDILKERVSSKTDYDKHINYLYAMSFCDTSLCYKELLGCAGKCYDSIRRYNTSLKIGPDYNLFDHFLIYCIAGWMKEHVSNTTVKTISQKEIARDITDNILIYLG